VVRRGNQTKVTVEFFVQPGQIGHAAVDVLVHPKAVVNAEADRGSWHQLHEPDCSLA